MCKNDIEEFIRCAAVKLCNALCIFEAHVHDAMQTCTMRFKNEPFSEKPIGGSDAIVTKVFRADEEFYAATGPSKNPSTMDKDVHCVCSSNSTCPAAYADPLILHRTNTSLSDRRAPRRRINDLPA